VECRPDGVQYVVRTSEDVAIPEAEKAEALGMEIGVTNEIALGLSVLGTICFNDEASLEADEICDVVSNRQLPTKLELGEATIAQEIPEFGLCFGGLPPHAARELPQKRRPGGSPLSPCQASSL
jgi:hypothetical protein